MIREFLPSFGRRLGRKLSPRQQELMDTTLPTLTLSIPEEGTFPAPGQYLPASLADRTPELWLEIGFGAGEHLAAMAARYPDIAFIGCEPFINGMASFLVRMEEQQLNNLRLYHDDARLLLRALPENSLMRTYILFPDPWPKLRHHKRRIINPETLDLLSRTLKSGGELRLATDDTDYCQWMLEHLLAHPDFRWMAHRANDFNQPFTDWTPTRYEQKTRKMGRTPTFLRFERV